MSGGIKDGRRVSGTEGTFHKPYVATRIGEAKEPQGLPVINKPSPGAPVVPPQKV